jgi:hypothetical protein
MANFRLVKKLEIDPFTLEVVSPDGDEIVPISIKHAMDWPEVSLDDFERIQNKWAMMDSLLKKQKTPPTDQQNMDAVVLTRAYIKLLVKWAFIEEYAVELWDTLSFVEKTQVVDAYQSWVQEETKKKVAEKKAGK